jgi:hypothetical protein
MASKTVFAWEFFVHFEGKSGELCSLNISHKLIQLLKSKKYCETTWVTLNEEQTQIATNVEQSIKHWSNTLL